MSRDDAVVREVWALRKEMDDMVRPERGYSPRFLTTPYTNTDFDGDSFSTVAANTIIQNTSWSTTIPANAVALLLLVSVRDSGSAANDTYFSIYPAAAAGTNAARICTSHINDVYNRETVVVPCTDGDIWYQCVASGAGTLDVYLWCFGYWV